MDIAAFKKTFGARCMKNLSFISLVLIIGIFSGCVVVVDDIVPIRGNGQLMYSEKAASSFDKINIEGSVKVIFHDSQEYRTVVTVDSNLIEYTEIYTTGNTLNIKTKNGHYSFTKYLVDVYCPVLTNVSVSGSGSFIGSDTINTSTFATNVSGSGKIEGSIECINFNAKITGSGNIAVSGKARDSYIDISGSGNFSGENFVVNNAEINVSGSGNADVYVTDYLNVNISGAGRINYWGNPIVKSLISGSGKIKKK